MPIEKIIIYSTPFCSYCESAKQYLDKNNISYQDVNVLQDKHAQEEMIKKSKQRGVPVIIIKKNGKENILVGFQKDRLKEILGL